MIRSTSEQSSRTPDRVVLVLRALGLGDALTGIPALRGIRRAYPDHRLLVACGAELGSWLTELGVVDGVVPTCGLEPITGAPVPDVAINLHGRGPRSHEILRLTGAAQLHGFACPAAGFPNGPRWDDGAHEVDRWCALVRRIGGECGRSDLRLTRPGGRGGRGTSAPVVIHPGAASASRRWPVSRWNRLVHVLSARSQVLITGGGAEADLCADVGRGTTAECVAGRTSIAELADVVSASDLVVSGDTGIAHLATAYGVPSVTMFGPVPPSLWGSAIDPHLHRCIWHGTAASAVGDPHGALIDPRLDAITVPEVLAAVHGLSPRLTGA
ncbi:MAG TPA: glycosyltransferase family 9 protein [Flexivirga sp.]|uniref:glycosyltransferase family 9 protein n=1 Tax=Flexivirga sp. TaxID=1962927 RepID=UPI002B7E92BE|nr:glycosyltransferase family 9 protein [Flexivirga sp.]HWC21775.1 glycosyltransferase family 9 protein [Flexivirga sp.]